MSTKTIETTLYTIDDHPAPDAVFDWIRNNWHELNSHSVDEVVDSCRYLAQHFDGQVSYAISAVPDRGQHITFAIINGDHKTMSSLKFNKRLPDLSGNCPLTGVCWDENLLDAFRDAQPDDTLNEVLHQAGQNVLSALHKDTEHLYSDDGLREMCEANEYYFNEDGSIE